MPVARPVTPQGRLGRFDRSFVIRMIRDFLIALTVIVVLELGGRAALAWRDFQQEDRAATGLAAARLASDVRDIMLNEGGPVAARTVYPILRRNHEELGYEIAIEPSAVTVESIRRGFGFEPRGMPSRWSAGPHHETTLELRAEEFCRTCHVTAQVGEVLGRVSVRSYRATRFAEFWHEARVVSVVGMGNVILHTVVLFFLLRLRMEPLLRLRATVARLAKGRLDLSQRAEPRSDDEFGELAVDLNHFLDRVSHLLEDLNGVLTQLLAVNDRMAQVSGRMGGQLGALEESAGRALAETVGLERLFSGPTEETLAALELVLTTLQDHPNVLADARVEALRGLVTRLRGQVLRARQGSTRVRALEEVLHRLSRELRDDTHYQREIVVLEERMRVVSESGRALLRRLGLVSGEVAVVEG